MGLKTGNERAGLVLQERDRHLLQELAIMRVVDREQAMVAAGFTSATRANVRLLALLQTGFLQRFFVGTVAGGTKALYTLSAKGAAAVDVRYLPVFRRQSQTFSGDLFLEHQMRINQVFLAVKYGPIPHSSFHFKRWLAYTEPISTAARIIPDGYFEVESGASIRAAFLEVDLGTESLSVWNRKVRSYLQLAISGEFTKVFHQLQFRVLVVAHSERRVKSIRSAVGRSTDKIFWLSSFDQLKREGFWSAVWLRPKGDHKLSLL